MGLQLKPLKRIITPNNRTGVVLIEGDLVVTGTSTLPGIASPTVTSSVTDFTTGRDAVVTRDVLVGRNLTLESSATPVLTVRDTTGPVAGILSADNSAVKVGSSTAHSTIILANNTAALTILSDLSAEFADALNVVGALTCDADIDAVGDITAVGFIGATIVLSGLATVDDLTVIDDVVIGGTTAATGLITCVSLTATGNMLVGGTLGVTGLLSAVDITTSDDLVVGDDLAVTGLATVGETLAVTGLATIGGTLVVTGAATFTAGFQAAAVAVTATVGGLTTGIIPAGASFVAVTCSDADHIVTLPTSAPVGTVVRGWVGTNGHEIRTTALSNETINDVDADGGAAEAAIPATTLWRAEKISSTGWILTAITKLGAAVAAIVPDAV